MILGLTGGIGSGKSTVTKVFQELGATIFDADLIAKSYLESDIIKDEIDRRIEKGLFNRDSGELNKRRLKDIVFSNKKMLVVLNEIIHPKVIERYRELSLKYLNSDKVIIFDVPLLFETGIDKYCNKIVVVDIERDRQIERIRKRDNIDIKLIKNIINSQMSSEERKKKANIIIDNNGTLEELRKKVENIYQKIKKG